MVGANRDTGTEPSLGTPSAFLLIQPIASDKRSSSSYVKRVVLIGMVTINRSSMVLVIPINFRSCVSVSVHPSV